MQDDDSEEIDDFTIRDSDLLLLTARNEDDVSNIEVQLDHMFVPLEALGCQW